MVTNPKHIGLHALLFSVLSLFVLGDLAPAFAQAEPPLDPPKLRSLKLPDNAIPIYGWALYPTLSASSVFDSNLYQSPTTPISAAGFLVSPSLVAIRSNGIHTTKLYGIIDSKIYPSAGENNTFDRQGGIIQTYEALRDLIFTFQGDYTHKTIASLFQNSIPGPLTGPANPPPLASGTVNALGTIVKNPYDQFTGTATVEKIFSRAYLKFGTSFARTIYEDPLLVPDFSVVTFTGSGAFWLVPAAFVYADGSYAEYSNQRAHRITAGLGSAKIGLFQGVLYVGHQGTEVDNSGTAGGFIFGGRLTYFATHRLTIAASFDEIFNDSNQTTTTLAVNPATILSGISVPTSASTRITATALKSDYVISKVLVAYAVLGYTRIEYVDTIERDDSWLAAAGLIYNVRPNLALTLNYIHSQVVSNVPNVSFIRDYVGLGAQYAFRPLP